MKQAVRHPEVHIGPNWNSCVYLELAPIATGCPYPRPEPHRVEEQYFAPSRKKPRNGTEICDEGLLSAGVQRRQNSWPCDSIQPLRGFSRSGTWAGKTGQEIAAASV